MFNWLTQNLYRHSESLISRRGFHLAATSLVISGVLNRKVTRSDRNRALAEWSQWGGPNRNFTLSEASLQISSTKPKLIWKRRLGRGQSAIVTKDGFAYSLHNEGDQELLKKWKITDGEKVWSCPTPVSYHASFSEYDGPHSTPVVLDRQVVSVGIDAVVRSIDTQSAKVFWETDLRSSFGPKLPQSGYACSPLVWKNVVILQTLGESRPVETERFERSPDVPADLAPIPGAVALDLQTGKEVWRTVSFRSSHSSPILVNVGGVNMIVFHAIFELVGVDPENGKILWRQLLRRRAADNVSFTPIWDEARSQFLITHGYCDSGVQAIRLEKKQQTWVTKVLWTNSQLGIVHTNAVLVGNILLGTKRPSATLLVEIDVRNGKTLFRRRGFGKANLIAIGEQILVLDEGGDLVGGRLSEQGFEENWKVPALSKTAWTVPTINDNLVLVRDAMEIKAYQFK